MPLYHVLLIGCDAYPAGYQSLSGCVNDIDAVERILLDSPSSGVPPDQIRITRLAAPRNGMASSSRLQAQTRAPTKANIVRSLDSLAGPQVSNDDRALIYYSGHGDQKRWPGNPTYREAIVPVDIQPIYDVEFNTLIHAIAARTTDLTVVLDSCHSAGGTRDPLERQPLGMDRFLDSGDELGPSPEPAILDLAESAQRASNGMLRSLDPLYVAVAACQAFEKASEGVLDGERSHGILSYSLLKLIGETEPKRRPELRWADLWPALLDSVNARCTELSRRSQHPWLIGRPERRVFGGAWEPGDAGYRAHHNPDGSYTIGAGSLMGLTAGAVIAVYGPSPPRFSPLGSSEDLQARIGQLRIVQAERATCTARTEGQPFGLPQGARGRLAQVGQSERLRVLIDPADPVTVAELTQSALLEVLPTAAVDVDVKVKASNRGDWTIGNETDAELATVPLGSTHALRAGLESYASYQTVLAMAQRCNDPQLVRCLVMRLLDCTNSPAVDATDLEDPNLPDAPRDRDRIYHLPANFPFCIQLGNDSTMALIASVFNCGAAGEVEYLGDVSLSPGDRQIIWLAGQLRQPFAASPDFPTRESTDRLVAIATTRPDLDLRYLEVPETVQQVVDRTHVRRDGDTRAVTRARTAGPAELWTAVIQPVRIGPAAE